MYPVSARFAAAVVDSAHEAVVSCALYRGPVLAAGPDEVQLLDGTVTVDATADVRRRLSAKVLVDADMLPTLEKRSAIDPYGNTIKIWRGVRWPDGSSELVPQGVFRVEVTEIDDAPAGKREVTLTGYDLSYYIANNSWTAPYHVAAGTNLITAISNVVADRLPGVSVSVQMSSSETSALQVWTPSNDPWKDAVQGLALPLGAEVFFGLDGECVIRPVPEAVPPAALTLSEGPDCVMTKLTRTYDATTARSAVVATSSSGSSSLRSVVYDTDPASPTYYLGAFGLRVEVITVNGASSQGALDQAALTKLIALSGASEQLEMEMVPNPAIDASDVHLVQRSSAGLDDLVVTQTFDLPLIYTGAGKVKYRVRRVVSLS